MKKKLLVLGAAAMLLTGCGGNNDPAHNHEWSTEWTCNKSEHWHSCNGCNEKKDNAAHVDANNDGICDVCNQRYHDPVIPTKLEIVKQPETVTIDFGGSISMNVKVNNPDLVKSYQWYVGFFEDGVLSEEAPLLGTKAKTDTYSLPNYISYYFDANYGFKCVITDKDDNEIVSDWGQVIVRPDEKDTPHIVVGDYLLTPGKTFDLANTSYGTGKITVNETCDHFIFDNVQMTNQFFESNFEGIGFRYLDYGPDFNDVTFEFVGKNNFENYYWNEDYVEGGCIFQYQVLGLDAESKGPTATFTGSGSVTFFGGSYSIVAQHANVVQDIDMSFYGQPNRYQRGIKCDEYTLCKDRLLRSSITGRVIDANGDVLLEEGSKFYANLGTAYCGQMGYVAGFNTVGDISINGADVKINIVLDFKTEVENEVFVIASGIECDAGEVLISNSNVDISILEYNSDFEVPAGISSATAVAGISSDFVKMSNSYLKVEIDGKNINEARAINSHGLNSVNCSFDIDVAGKTAGGIDCYALAPEKQAPVTFENTNADIDLHNYLLDSSTDVILLPFDDTAILGTSFTFTSSSENKIEINTNGGATICVRTGTAEEPVKPHDGYSGRNLDFDNVSYKSSKTYCYNEESYSSTSGHNIVIETLYENLGSGNYKHIDNLVITYSAK